MSTANRPPATARDDRPPDPDGGGASVKPWHPHVPDGCRKCGKRDYPHQARGLCNACYQWEERYGFLGWYPRLPAAPSPQLNSWEASGRHATTNRNHQRLRAQKLERLDRLWHTDGPLIPAASCEMLAAPRALHDYRRHDLVRRNGGDPAPSSEPPARRGFREPWEDVA